MVIKFMISQINSNMTSLPAALLCDNIRACECVSLRKSSFKFNYDKLMVAAAATVAVAVAAVRPIARRNAEKLRALNVKENDYIW